MKKNLLGLFALVLAFGLSAFTNSDKHTNKTEVWYNWFNSDNEWIASNHSTASPVSGCVTGGSNCARGFTADAASTTYPGGTPDFSYKTNTK